MNALTLRQFRYFQALARHRHFGRAAEACHVSQPALSLQIKELEARLGVRLVERQGRQIRLTRLGQEFAARAGAILRQVEELGDFMRLSQGDLVGPFRLGLIPTVAPYLLPAIMGMLGQRFPKMEPQLRETVTQGLLRELKDGQLDAAILALPVNEPGLTELPLIQENFVLVRPAYEASLPVPDGEGLARMKLLLLEEGHCFRDQALAFCGGAAARPSDLMDGSALSTLVQMVGAGIGVTLIPEMAVPVETRSAAVAVQQFHDPCPARSIGMVWRSGSAAEAPLRQLAEGVKEAAKTCLSHASLRLNS